MALLIDLGFPKTLRVSKKFLIISLRTPTLKSGRYPRNEINEMHGFYNKTCAWKIKVYWFPMGHCLFHLWIQKFRQCNISYVKLQISRSLKVKNSASRDQFSLLFTKT
jgi:hypothetical protein